MYGPKESEQRQTPRPVGRAHAARADADFVVASDGTTIAGKSPVSACSRRSVSTISSAGYVPGQWIIGAVVLCMAAALFYAVTPPRYTVYTDILIDPSNLNVVRDDVFTSNPQARWRSFSRSRASWRILDSRNVLSRVIDSADLATIPNSSSRAC